MNYVSISGRLGRDLELRTSEKGVISTFGSIAVDNSYVKDGNKVEVTDWVPFTLYDKQAENIVKYAGKKGNRILLTGKLSTKKTEADKYPVLTFKALHAEYMDFNKKEDQPAPVAAHEEQPF